MVCDAIRRADAAVPGDPADRGLLSEAYSGSAQDMRKVVDTVGDYMGVSRDHV